jgi:uncharacterized protein Yka (UPF0111/DUF47 family)
MEGIMGELKKLTRLVQRRDLKTQIKLLKQIISTHEPLVKAMEVTKKAYQEGIQAGFQKAVKELEQAEQVKKQEQDLTEFKMQEAAGIIPSKIVVNNQHDHRQSNEDVTT